MKISRRSRWYGAGALCLSSAFLLGTVFSMSTAAADQDRRNERRGNAPSQPQGQGHPQGQGQPQQPWQHNQGRPMGPQPQPAQHQQQPMPHQQPVQPQPPQGPHRGPAPQPPAPQPTGPHRGPSGTAPGGGPHGPGPAAVPQQPGHAGPSGGQPHGGFVPPGPSAGQPHGAFVPPGPSAGQPHGTFVPPGPQPHGHGVGPAVREPGHGTPPGPIAVPEHGRPRPQPMPPGHVGRGGGPMAAHPEGHGHPVAPVYRGRPLAPQGPVYVAAPPPRPRIEVRPMRPSPTHVWVGGYWAYQGDNTVWVDGGWEEPPQPGYVWVEPRWRRHGHRWAFVPGYWRHHHGPVYIESAPVGPPPTYAGGPVTISGHVTTVDGAPVPGIMVTLAGSQEGHIVTDNSGYYVFANLPPGSYAIRPTGGGCAFAPDVVNLNNLYASVNQNIIVSGCPGW